MVRYHARWLLPVSAPPVEYGTVAVAKGRIVYVGPRATAPPGPDRDLGAVALLPGLVNVHTHLELTTLRGFLEGLEFGAWVRTLVGARESVLDGPARLDAARLGVTEGLAAGVTTYADTGSSDAALHAMRELGVRGIAYQETFGPDPRQCAGSLAELQTTIARLRPLATALVRLGVSPHAPYTVSDALFAAVATYAAAEGLPVAVHVAESEAEGQYVVDGVGAFAESLRARGIAVSRRGRSPIALLEATGILRTRPLLIHCVATSPDDVATMRERDCAVAHCPASNAKLGHGVAPLIEWLAAGLRVGLGSDSMASNNRMDVLDEARLAMLFAAARSRRSDALSASRAVELATLGGARALGLDAEVGTLEVGKAADLAAFPLDDPRGIPIFDPAVSLVAAVAGRRATFVAVAGEVRVLDGTVLRADAALGGRVADAARRLAAWRDGAPPPRS